MKFSKPKKKTILELSHDDWQIWCTIDVGNEERWLKFHFQLLFFCIKHFLISWSIRYVELSVQLCAGGEMVKIFHIVPWYFWDDVLCWWSNNRYWLAISCYYYGNFASSIFVAIGDEMYNLEISSHFRWCIGCKIRIKRRTDTTAENYYGVVEENFNGIYWL